MLTHAFTCTGPYAILIMLGLKRVENRSVMPSPSKGRCAVSCSKSFCKEEYGNFVQWASRALSAEDFESIPFWSDVKDWPGKIVGCCDYGCRSRDDLTLTSDDEGANAIKWDEGYPYWWDLSEIVCFDTPIPCRGNVGMWQMPDSLAAQVTHIDLLASTVGKKIATAEEAAAIFRLALPIADKSEGLFVLPLDDAHRTLSAPILVSLGTATSTAVRPKDVFSEVLKLDASSFIIAHNHPSGNASPSIQDKRLTSEMARLGEAIGIKMLDHLIVTKDAFASVCKYRTSQLKLFRM